jgi:hypothetical protein
VKSTTFLMSSAFTASMCVIPSAPRAAPGGPPTPKTLASIAPPPEKSAVPTSSEWQSAASFQASRVSPDTTKCAMTYVREWVRVRCPIKTFAISLLGGSNEGLSFWIGPEDKDQPGEVQFPLRRGDRRIVQLWGYGTDASGGVKAMPRIVIQEHWVEGEAAPTITVL